MIYRYILLFTLLIGLSLLTIFYFNFFAHPKNKIGISFNSNEPDAFMEDVESWVMDKNGLPKMKIETPSMVHFSQDDTTRFLSPHLTLYRDSPEPWYISSRFAKASGGITTVNFWDSVAIKHAADTKSPQTLIKTDQLTVYPNNETAETTNFITMIQPDLIVKAIGMFANMKTGDIKLLSQARGEYAPQ